MFSLVCFLICSGQLLLPDVMPFSFYYQIYHFEFKSNCLIRDCTPFASIDSMCGGVYIHDASRVVFVVTVRVVVCIIFVSLLMYSS